MDAKVEKKINKVQEKVNYLVEKLEQFRLFTFLAKHFDDSKVYRIFADETNLIN